MHLDPESRRAKAADDRLWEQMQMVYANCGPDSQEWAKVVAMIAATELAERELAYQLVNGRVRFTSPN